MGPSVWEEKLRLYGGGPPKAEGEAHGRSFLGPQRTCVLGVCLRVCELRAVGKAECHGHQCAPNSCIGPSLSLLPFGSEFPPRLFTQSCLSRPQGQPWLTCLLGVCRRQSPSPAHPLQCPPPSSLPCLSSPALWLAYGSHFYLSTAPGCCLVLCSSERNPQSPCRAISKAACEAASCLQGASGPVTSV